MVAKKPACSQLAVIGRSSARVLVPDRKYQISRRLQFIGSQNSGHRRKKLYFLYYQQASPACPFLGCYVLGHMATTAQVLSNATGPRTEAGKAISSRNATKHGLASGVLFLADEDPAEFTLLLEGLRADHSPVGATEELLIADMAKHHWLMDRAMRLQNRALLDNQLDRLALFLRYQTANHRAFHKSLAVLQNLRKQFVSKSVVEPTELSAPTAETVPPQRAEAPSFPSKKDIPAPPPAFRSGRLPRHLR